MKMRNDNTIPQDEPPPTSSALLGLCNLPSSSLSSERQTRLSRIKSWCARYPATTFELFTSSEYRDKKTGCMPLHWMAGTGFDEAIEFVLGRGDEKYERPGVPADQRAHHPSTRRTPLHYAARNGHLSTCRLLVEAHGADPDPGCGRGGVTPLQLAVWQNRLAVVRYLVGRNGAHAAHGRNGFDCGLMHWIGLVPRERWSGDGGGDDGSGVLPLARYLHSLGVKFDSTRGNSNSQGHTPNHKAAWGGNLPLLRYFRDEHGVHDTVQDYAGNYCADIARMRKNVDCHRWLLEHGSGDRAESYRVLGLDVGADMEMVRKRYFELALANHPDKTEHQSSKNDETKEEGISDFMKIKSAYEHLTKEGGVGRQKNPKYDELKLLEDHRRMKDAARSDGLGNDKDDLFIARLIAVLSDYGNDGFPVSLIARRWNQIWPDRPFPTAEELVIERTVRCGKQDGDGLGEMVLKKRVKLLKFLRWKCKGTAVYFRNVDGVVLAFDSTPQKMDTSS